MRDYSERRQSRVLSSPKRPKVWPQLLLILTLLLIAFGSGFGTGWYLYRPGGKLYKSQQIPQTATVPKTQSSLPPQGQPIAPAPAQNTQQTEHSPEKTVGAPPLTFYNTLQKGNKGLMGTGINQSKELPQTPQTKTSPVTPSER
jgi:hypothetical protein